MNERSYDATLMFSTASVTAAGTATYKDLAPSASIGKREMKAIVVASAMTLTTSTTAEWDIVIRECDTTAGTYTDVAGDTCAVTTNGLATFHIKPAKRYLRAQVSTVGAGGTGVALHLVVLNMNRVF
jgi:hypothetical protein